MNAEKRQAIYETLRELNPHPTTELEFSSPFELLIAVMLSAQATDVSVNKAMRKMFPQANTPTQIVALGEAGVTEFIKTIGLYRTKAKNVIATCRLLLERHDGQVPEQREALEALPGVGRKTANVILNTAFGHPLIAVDTHIFRVANRTGIAPGKDVRTVEDKLAKVTPDEFLHDAHHWLLLHGRYVCKARRPECWHCAIETLCEFKPKTPAPSEAEKTPRTVKVAKLITSREMAAKTPAGAPTAKSAGKADKTQTSRQSDQTTAKASVAPVKRIATKRTIGLKH